MSTPRVAPVLPPRQVLEQEFWGREVAHVGYLAMELFGGFAEDIDGVLNELMKTQVFSGEWGDFQSWKESPADAARIIWEELPDASQPPDVGWV